MKIKHIILFIVLTAVLMLLAHWLLSTIDSHKGFLPIMLLSLCVLADIFFMTRFFSRFMNS